MSTKRLKPLAGETWFVKVPMVACALCVLIDEVTAATVVMIPQADVSTFPDRFREKTGAAGVRYPTSDVEFLERVDARWPIRAAGV